jgi:hypothetical protein
MPIIDTPNGSFRIEDGASPDAIAAARADFMKHNPKPIATIGPGAPQPTEYQKRVSAQADAELKHGAPGDGLAHKFVQGLTFNNLDELNAGAHALVFGGLNAIKHGDIREIGRDYGFQKDVEHEIDRRGDGVGGTVAEIAGALANPIGTGAKGLQALKFAPRLVKAGDALERAPALVQGVVAGANQGALNAVGSADDSSHLLRDTANGALGGGIAGGMFGGAVTGLRRAGQIFADRGENAAERVAYNHIANMLGKADISPTTAQRRLLVDNGRGGDNMVMDLSPGLGAQASALAKRPEIPTSNRMIERAQDRIAERPDRLDEQLRAGISTPSGEDATGHINAVTGARKAHGDIDYKAALDGKFAWNHELQDFVDHAPAEVHAAFRDGAHLADLHDQDIGQLGMHIGEDGKPIFNTTPSMRVFDYTKRAMDAKISAALKSGDNAYASGLSNQLNKFKALVSKANPDYAPILAKQRDSYQQVEATNTGLQIVQRLKKDPRQLATELNALPPEKQDDARTGILQAMLGMHNNRKDTVAFLKSISNSPDQRPVMEFVFGGKQNYTRFEKWMNSELKGRTVDQKIAPGYQSITGETNAAQHSLSGDVGQGVEHGLRGFAYGGSAGMTAAMVRWLDDMRKGLSPHALDAIAQILMSKGIDLPKNIEASKAFYAARKLNNSKAAVAAAKAGQQPYTDMIGN